MEISDQLGYLLFFVAFAMAFKTWDVRRALSRAKSDWKRAHGEIVSSLITYETSGTAENRSSLYKADLSYRYEAGGRERRGKRICVGGQFRYASPSRAQDYCEKYPEGKSVVVHYDPKKPDDAVLELREETSFAAITVGVLAAIGGYYLVT